MNIKRDITFIDSPAVKGREDQFQSVTIKLHDIVKAWRSSVFSFQWLDRDGNIRPLGGLPDSERVKREKVEKVLEAGKDLEKPVLGIGMMDNVEIGAGKAVLLTLAAHGVETMPVHVRASHIDAFQPYLAS